MRNPPKKKAGCVRSSTPHHRTKRPARVEPVVLPVRYRTHRKRVPLDQCPHMVAYLAGPEAGFVTGASLTIDGGFNA